MFKSLPQSIIVAQHAFLRLVESLQPTFDELDNWLLTLDISPSQREYLRALGPLSNWTAQPYAWSFREYVTDRRAVLMVDYMAENLSGEDYAQWVDFHGQGEGRILRILANRPK